MISEAYFHLVPTSLPEVTVATVTAAAVSATATRGEAGLLVQAHPENGANVFVGGPGVSTGTGIVLEPGASLHIELSNAANLYAISAVDGQRLRILVL